MTDEPGEVPAAAGPVEPGSVEPGSVAPSTEIVPVRRAEVAAPGRWAHLATGLRGRLVELRRHPAAVASVSAATTIGGALLVNALRANALRHVARAVAARPPAQTSHTVLGYIRYDVHVFHHLPPSRDT